MVNKEDYIKEYGKSIFKSCAKNNYSLTYDGFLKLSKTHNFFYIKYKDVKTKELMNLSKVFKCPYFISHEKNIVYHLDDLIDVQAIFYKDDLGALLDSFL